MARGLMGLGVAVLLAGCAAAATDRAPLSAGAALTDKDGKDVGRATLIQTGDRVLIAVTGYRLPPGPHGLHIHAVGRCEPPEFLSAGGHFNPGGKKHGLENPEGPHAGDLPNLVASPAGEGGVNYTSRLVTLGAGPGSLFGPGGTALVIHAGPDDGKTDPAGNAGARLACGVIGK